MAKDKTMYVCSNCGYESAKWLGKCPACGEWESFKEFKVAKDAGSNAAQSAALSLRHGNGHPALLQSGSANRPVRLKEISAKDEPRIDTHDD